MSKKQVDDEKAECVKVVIRVRPMSTKELTDNRETVVHMKQGPKNGEVFVNKPDDNEPEKQFTFDNVYDDKAAQKDIYLDCAAKIVANVLEGYNGTIFAYGQTGTGKTHTMTGLKNEEDKGIMPRAFEDVFR